MRVHLRRLVSLVAALTATAGLLLSFLPHPAPLAQPRQPRLELFNKEDRQWLDPIIDHKAVAPPRDHENGAEELFLNAALDDADQEEDGRPVLFPQYRDGGHGSLSLWPESRRPYEDRILDQMRHVPAGGAKGMTLIYVPGGLGETPKGRDKFLEQSCPVDKCFLTDSRKFAKKAEVLLFQNEYYYDEFVKPEHQLWVLWLLESPFHTGPIKSLANRLNWTATYRSDSTIVTPYEKFVNFANYTGLPKMASRNYAKGKTKLVAWFVSNCVARNKRWEYAQALKMYGVDVHIYGACGDFECDRMMPGVCDELLSREYKFYLSFENSNCAYYITEKFFSNALRNDIVPLVMGARPQDYRAVAPPNSYIHVEDFAGPKELAEYLLLLDKNDHLYNDYFRWKGTGEFINTKFWCRLCSLVHEKSAHSLVATDPDGWWRGNSTCVYDRWDDQQSFVTDWTDQY